MNLEFDLLVNLAIALRLGALIGAEREVTEIGKKQREEGIEFSGLRTFTLISLLGFLAGARAIGGEGFSSEFFSRWWGSSCSWNIGNKATAIISPESLLNSPLSPLSRWEQSLSPLRSWRPSRE